MKRFDTTSIEGRLLDSLVQKADWKRIIEESAVRSLITTIAEGNAELARYLEYLLRESRWDLAKNLTSLLAMAPYLGYKASRKISAIGYVYVSHDPLLAEAGSTFFESQLNTLSSYTGSEITIPFGTKITDGVRTFITTQDVTYSPLLNGEPVKYLKIPIIQGIRRNFITQRPAAGTSFETIRIPNSSIENASDEVSSKFLVVKGYLGGNLAAEPEVFEFKEDIHLANDSEYAYDINTASDYSYIDIRFGDGFSGKILPPGTVVSVSYLESMGYYGNQPESYTISKFDVDSTSDILRLYCTNFDPCLGGRDEDTIEDVRGKAPTQYLLDGSIITEDAYRRAIEAIPFISKATVYSGVGQDELGIWKDMIRYSAINVLGQTPERSFVEEAVLARLEGKKSPLDILIYDEPKYVGLKLNIIGKVNNKEADITAISSQVKTLLYDRYNVFNVKFQEGFDPTELINTLKAEVPMIQNVNLLLETYNRLAPSQFLATGGGAVFEKTFTFDTSFVGLRGFGEGKKYAVKIDIYFKCAECQQNNRTIFCLYDEQLGYRVAQFPYIENITSTDFMSSNVLRLGVYPEEITAGNPNYIPISVVIDDITKPIWTGTVAIPLKKPNSSAYYINFQSADADSLDEQVLVDVCAEPISYDLTLREVDDAGYPQKNRILMVGEDDIRVELSYK